MTPQEEARLQEAAVQVVLRASREGRLIAAAAALAELAAGGYFAPGGGGGDAGSARPAPPESEAAVALAGLLAQDARLASFPGLDGQTLYHAPDLLSRTYARILARRGSPVLLMAEEIRANSRDYPRPLPVELFQSPPFALSPQEIESALRAMAADPQYRDIALATTPNGADYLFSTLHLERRYAEFLALRAESLAMNP